MRAEDYMLWKESEEMGMLGVSVRKMKALTVKMEAIGLIGKGRYNLTCFVYEVYATDCKIFFIADVLFGGGGRGGCLILEPSGIRVSMVTSPVLHAHLSLGSDIT